MEELFSTYIFVSAVVSLIVAAALAVIPASIAKNKGYDFAIWWLYGWLLFIVAIIHVNFIPDKSANKFPIKQKPPVNADTPAQNTGKSAADELKKYKELMDKGVITPEEFQAKKEQLLKLL